MARRVTLSTALLVGAATLVVAIVVGNSMGNKVLGQIGRFPTVGATPIEIPTPGTTPVATQAWKHVSLAAVATDPAFPDPRVTPPPPPPAPPAPTRRPATPTPAPTASFAPEPSPVSTFDYTSPPLPIPLESSAGVPSSAPVESPAPAPSSDGGRSARSPASKPTPNAEGP